MCCSCYDKYGKKFVFFIDILGFKNIVETTKKPSDVIKVINALSEIFEQENKEQNPSFKFDFNIAQISDCIIISFDTSKNFEFYYLLLLMARVQINAFINHGLLFRGGGAYGEMVHDNKYLFGKAYQEAYKIESKKAIYPRIMFKKELLDLVTDKNQKELIMELLEDDDKYYYIDFIKLQLISCLGEKEKENVKKLKMIKSHIANGLKEEDPNVFKKYKWLKKHYNKWVRDFNNKSNEKLERI